MSRKENIEKKTEELLEPIAKENGVSIYDVEYVKEAGEWYLRAYIDKPEGVNINDCVNVNHALSDALDVDDFIEEAYTLEVSSPGLGRTLKKDRHFANSLGMEVELKLYKPVDGTKEFSGILKSFDAENVVITINDQDKTFVRKEISVIKLALDF
ncbi:ribosome maturation factor RimP [Butyrivibrio sp.]|jgi:ribosome maturation factor RimP|uniref:ribosome maturation factor RimP n=1 Tax=Butyrivibrio sp. TaxID=28121 RepID=UPI0025C6CF35|nr:ribosome maturation factor RimP [Butyrivibrio sp.]MBE5833073.1 ribosome maturation factor RimP [Butyrivibrio sp.]MBQ7430530.1 ribosome maturation factor RimP [Butyrivibrio sp.]MBQ9301794.1 ribosome maturation factor RimP [Butyrivibrio sp.]MCR4833476.1 ribosome maturation factor RimP [Butyrivibrio sp.]